jgi:hypothetical protein
LNAWVLGLTVTSDVQDSDLVGEDPVGNGTNSQIEIFFPRRPRIAAVGLSIIYTEISR